MRITIISTLAKNRTIGLNGKMPWPRIPGDLKRFKEITMGHAVVMGRKTFESLPKPLEGRANIVITSDIGRVPRGPGVLVAPNLETALDMAKYSGPEHRGEVFVIGGGQVYAEALPIASKMLLTHIHIEYEGDVFFPDFDASEWLITDERHVFDEPANSFLTYVRSEKKQ